MEPRAHLVTALASDGTSFEALLGHREHLGVLLLSQDRGAQVGTDCVLLINTSHHQNCYMRDLSRVRQDTPLWVRDMLTPHPKVSETRRLLVPGFFPLPSGAAAVKSCAASSKRQ